MPRPEDRDPVRGSRLRASLKPGDDSWRAHVSEGALRAYDGPLALQREEAEALRRKGRFSAAHRREQASYKIRLRGHDRAKQARQRGPEAAMATTGDTGGVAKGIRQKAARKTADNAAKKVGQVRRTEKTLRLGPFERTTRDMRVGPRSRGEEIGEVVRNVGSGVGGAKLAVGLVAGAAGGGAATKAVERSENERVRDRLRAALSSQNPRQEVPVGKMLVPVEPPSRTLVLTKSYDEDGLVELYKGFWGDVAGKAKGAFKSATNDAAGAWRTTRLGPTPGSYDEAAQSAFNSLKDSVAGKTAAYAGLAGAAGWGAKAGYGRYIAPRIGQAKKVVEGYKKKALYGGAALAGTAIAAPTIGSYMGARSGS